MSCTYRFLISKRKTRDLSVPYNGPRFRRMLSFALRDTLISNLIATTNGLAGDRSTVLEIRLVRGRGWQNPIRGGPAADTPGLGAF